MKTSSQWLKKYLDKLYPTKYFIELIQIEAWNAALDEAIKKRKPVANGMAKSGDGINIDFLVFTEDIEKLKK
jgi:hypothetical protein